MIKVLVVDDHPVYRDGVVMALGASQECVVVGEGHDGDQAVALAEELRPDVVLLDLRMPGTDGLQAIRLLRAGTPSARIIVLTMFEDDASVRAALRAGACGYLVKGAAREDIVRAVVAVAQGQVVFAGSAAVVVQRALAGPDTGSSPRALLPMLSDREVEVLDLLARGRTNTQIARRLFISEKTVRNHVSHILLKLGVSGRAHAVAAARDVGFGTGAG